MKYRTSKYCEFKYWVFKTRKVKLNFQVLKARKYRKYWRWVRAHPVLPIERLSTAINVFFFFHKKIKIKTNKLTKYERLKKKWIEKNISRMKRESDRIVEEKSDRSFFWRDTNVRIFFFVRSFLQDERAPRLDASGTVSRSIGISLSRWAFVGRLMTDTILRSRWTFLRNPKNYCYNFFFFQRRILLLQCSVSRKVITPLTLDCWKIRSQTRPRFSERWSGHCLRLEDQTINFQLVHAKKFQFF